MAARKAAAKKAKKQPGGSLLDLPWDWPPHQRMLVEDKHPAVWILGFKMQEVVGEASHVPQLQALVQRLKLRGLVRFDASQTRCLATGTAWLIPEPTNEEDPNATAIYVDQLKVGYFSLEANERWGPVVRGLSAHYRRPVACGAIVVGRIEGQLGVWLMLDTETKKEAFRPDFVLEGEDLPY